MLSPLFKQSPIIPPRLQLPWTQVGPGFSPDRAGASPPAHGLEAHATASWHGHLGRARSRMYKLQGPV